MTALRTGYMLSLCLFLVACGGAATSRLNPDQSNLQPAVSDAPRAQALLECAYLYNRNGNNNHNFCRLERLPLLGQDYETIGVDEILERTLVTHPWMAERFEQLLGELPDDLLQLFQATTAVVIGANIRPSYYWGATGAIYLDPANLWLTTAERNTISRAPDYRSDFAQELDFVSLARYVEGNQRAWPSYSLSGPVSNRPLADIVRPMAALLFHELAHANDYVPPAYLPQLSAHNHRPLWQAIGYVPNTVSEVLVQEYPLHSTLLFELADVMYNGTKASAALKAVDALQVGLAFEVDGASDDYAYSYPLAEDTAMLFEEVMMNYHFGVAREVAYSNVPSQNNPDCNHYLVHWGVRHRAGDPQVRHRAGLVLQQLLNRADVSDYLAALPEPSPLINGLGWCANLNQFGVSSDALPLGIQLAPEPLPMEDVRSHSGGPGHGPQHRPGHPAHQH